MRQLTRNMFHIAGPVPAWIEANMNLSRYFVDNEAHLYKLQADGSLRRLYEHGRCEHESRYKICYNGHKMQWNIHIAECEDAKSGTPREYGFCLQNSNSCITQRGYKSFVEARRMALVYRANEAELSGKASEFYVFKIL